MLPALDRASEHGRRGEQVAFASRFNGRRACPAPGQGPGAGRLQSYRAFGGAVGCPLLVRCASRFTRSASCAGLLGFFVTDLWSLGVGFCFVGMVCFLVQVVEGSRTTGGHLSAAKVGFAGIECNAGIEHLIIRE